MSIPLAPWCPLAAAPALRGTSSIPVTSLLPAHEPVRWGYLQLGPQHSPPPLLSASPWLPRSMIDHLMRNKKDRAIGVKFASITGRDAVTNMEGAMHTFLTPLAEINMHGDYAYKGRHMVDAFQNKDGKQRARKVLLSAMVHPDFEGHRVMFKLAALGPAPVIGRHLGENFTIPSPTSKDDEAFRDAYDSLLRRHMVLHLTAAGRLPAEHSAMSYDQAVNHMSACGSPVDKYVRIASSTLSLELLFNTSVQQVINEFSALEALCPNGYVYTYDPPAIFAQAIGALLLNRLYIAALAHVAALNPFHKLRCFAFNDYDDRAAIPLIKQAFKGQPHISVVPKASLFPRGRYAAPANASDALLVLHNNSDAFGQNIETEADGGSMDGAIGNHSSAAASLHRQHPNLVNQVMHKSARMRG